MHDTDATEKATKDGHGDSPDLAVNAEMRQHLLVDRCPDSSGDVPGDGVFNVEYQTGATLKGVELSAGATLNARATITGHVGDDGKLRDFDFDWDGTMLVEGGIRGKDGRLYAKDAPRLYRVQLMAHGLTPEQVHRDQERFHYVRAIAPEGHDLGYVVRGRSVYYDDVAAALDKLALENATFDVIEAADYLERAEAYWSQTDHCVGVALTAPKTTLAPGESVPVTATIAPPPKRPAKGVAPGRFTADDGLSPASGSYRAGEPIRLTYTAGADSDTTCVKTLSRQGAGEGCISFQVAAPHYALTYAHTSTASYSYPFGPEGTFDDHGTESEQRDVALSASVPLTFDAAHTTATGTGTLAWKRSSWTTDDDDTSRSGQASSTWCDIDSESRVTGTKPGTLQVRSLKLGATAAGGRPTVSGLDVVLADAGERWHLDETQVSGPCPAFDSDDDQEIFLNQFASFHMGRGDQASYVPDGNDPSSPDVELKADSGWVPGSGGVLAQRTFSGDYADGSRSGAPAGAVVHWTDTFQLMQVSG